VDWKVLTTVFATLFIAERGNKTRLARLLFAADKEMSKWPVFIGAPAALLANSAPGVPGGAVISRSVSERTLHMVAGIGFIAIGAWTLLR
jgi:putative Ca2+/H+ antiporter (TMEM165/GDT1 family)